MKLPNCRRTKAQRRDGCDYLASDHLEINRQRRCITIAGNCDSAGFFGGPISAPSQSPLLPPPHCINSRRIPRVRIHTEEQRSALNENRSIDYSRVRQRVRQSVIFFKDAQFSSHENAQSLACGSARRPTDPKVPTSTTKFLLQIARGVTPRNDRVATTRDADGPGGGPWGRVGPRG